MNYYYKLYDIIAPLYSKVLNSDDRFETFLESVKKFNPDLESELCDFTRYSKEFDLISISKLKRSFYKNKIRFQAFVKLLSTNIFYFLYNSVPIPGSDTISQHYLRGNVHFDLALFFILNHLKGETHDFLPIFKMLVHEFDENHSVSFGFSLYEILIDFNFSNSNINEFEIYTDYFQDFRKRYEVFISLTTMVKFIALNYRSKVYHDNKTIEVVCRFFETFIRENDLDQIKPSALYYFFLLRIEYDYLVNRPNLISTLNQFQSFLDISRETIGNVNFFTGINNLVLNYFILGQNNRAISLCDKYFTTISNFERHFYNMSILLLTYHNFCCNFKEYNLIRIELDSVIGNVKKFLPYFHLLSLSDAAHHHLTGNYKQSYLCLNDAAPLLHDKEGFGLGIRILEILNLIRTENFGQVENALLNMKNQLTFLKKGGKIKPRFIYIYKILVKLHNTGYNYKKTFQAYKEKFRLMSTTDYLYAWEFRSPELIRFDSWYFEQAGFFPEWELNDPRMDAMNPLLNKG